MDWLELVPLAVLLVVWVVIRVGYALTQAGRTHRRLTGDHWRERAKRYLTRQR